MVCEISPGEKRTEMLTPHREEWEQKRRRNPRLLLCGVALRLLLRTLREMPDITELTPTLVNSLIERIEVYNNDKLSGHCYVKADICFTAAGMIDIPKEQKILAIYRGNTEKPRRTSALQHNCKRKRRNPFY